MKITVIYSVFTATRHNITVKIWYFDVKVQHNIVIIIHNYWKFTMIYSNVTAMYCVLT